MRLSIVAVASLCAVLAMPAACAQKPAEPSGDETGERADPPPVERPAIDENWEAMGVWRSGFEESAFWTSDGEGPIWLKTYGDYQQLRSYMADDGIVRHGGGPALRLTVRGRIERGDPNGYGHLGAYVAEGDAQEYVSIEAITAEEYEAEVARIRASRGEPVQNR